MIRKDEKTAVIEANRTHPTDTGSPEEQGWRGTLRRPFFPCAANRAHQSQPRFFSS